MYSYNFEAAAILLPSNNIIVASVYHFAGNNDDLFIENLERLIILVLKLLKHKNCRILITGDINIDIRYSSKSVNYLIDTLSSLNFYCLNDEPTRLKACMDNIICNFHKSNSQLGLINLGISDHEGILLRYPLSYKTKIHPKPARIIRPTNHLKLHKLRGNVTLINWNTALPDDMSVSKLTIKFMMI